MFRQVVDHIHAVREAGFPLLLTITPNRFSGEDVFKTIRLARSIIPNVDISTSLFSLRDGPQREGSEDLDAEFYARILRFDRELRGLPLHECPESDLPAPGGPLRACDERGLECGGGRSGFVIDWQGRMRICNRLEVISEPMRVGFGEASSTPPPAIGPRCQNARNARINKCVTSAPPVFCSMRNWDSAQPLYAR